MQDGVHDCTKKKKNFLNFQKKRRLYQQTPCLYRRYSRAALFPSQLFYSHLPCGVFLVLIGRIGFHILASSPLHTYHEQQRKINEITKKLRNANSVQTIFADVLRTCFSFCILHRLRSMERFWMKLKGDFSWLGRRKSYS